MTRFAVVCSVFLIVLAFGCGSKDPTDMPLSPAMQAQLDNAAQAENHTSYQDPKATWTEGFSYNYRNGTMAVGGVLAKIVLLALMLVATILVLSFVPKLVHGKVGTVISGAALLLTGFVLLGSGWPATLGESLWVWLCLLLPGAILFIAGWFVEEGPWEVLVAFTPWSILAVVLGVRLMGLILDSLVAGCILTILLVLGLVIAVLRMVKFASGGDQPSTAVRSPSPPTPMFGALTHVPAPVATTSTPPAHTTPSAPAAGPP